MSVPHSLKKNFFFDPNILGVVKKFNTFSTLNSALDIFRQHNNVPACEFIVKQGADNLYDNLYEACKNGQLKMVKLITKQKFRIPFDYFKVACENGHTEIVKHLFFCGYCHLNNKDNNLNESLMLACKSGEIKCVQFLIDSGANDFRKGLEGAYEGGHEHVMELMSTLFQKSVEDCKTPDVNLTYKIFMSGLIGACRGGHESVVNHLLKKYSNQSFAGIVVIKSVCFGGNFKIAKQIFELMADKLISNEAFAKACGSGNMDIINMLLDYNNDNFVGYKFNYNSGMIRACENNQIHVVKYMIELGASDWNDGLRAACSGNNFELVKLMVVKAQESACDIEWNTAFCYSCGVGNLEIMEYIYNIGNKSSWRFLPCLSMACDSHKIDAVKWVIKRVTPLPSFIVRSIMEHACCSGDIYVARYLIDKFNSPNNRTVANLVICAYNHKNDNIGNMLLEQVRDRDKIYLYNCASHRKMTSLVDQLLLRFPDQKFQKPKYMSLRSFKKLKI